MRSWRLLILSGLCLAASVLAFREDYNAAGFAILAAGYHPPPFHPDARFWKLSFAGSAFLALSLIAFQKGHRQTPPHNF